MTAMENPKKRLKLDYETKTMEDLPVEIILKIFDFVNIRDLFQCMAVNKKIREIANDQSLWNILMVLILKLICQLNYFRKFLQKDANTYHSLIAKL